MSIENLNVTSMAEEPIFKNILLNLNNLIELVVTILNSETGKIEVGSFPLPFISVT